MNSIALLSILLLGSQTASLVVPHQYVFFGLDRASIHSTSFLTSKAEGAQLKYTWRELEPARDHYDFSSIRADLTFLRAHGKKLFLQIQDVSFGEQIVNVPKYVVEEIRKLDRERIQAQVNADAAALDRIYADDFIGIGPSGTLRTKKEVLADFTSGSLKFQWITTDDVRIRVYGNAAVETDLSTMKGQDAGKVVPEENRFTRVWIKQGGRWRLVANHYSNLAKPH